MSSDIYQGGVFVDDRGEVRFVNDFDFRDVKRFYQVENHRRGFIRAWHGHRHEGKYVYVARGSALVGVVHLESDLCRRMVLPAQSPQVLWVPPNHANGFMTLEEDTLVMFYSTATLEESQNDDLRFPYDRWDIWKIDFR